MKYSQYNHLELEPEILKYWKQKKVLQKLKDKHLLTDMDINTDAIWPGISQYLIPELNRSSDKKRGEIFC